MPNARLIMQAAQEKLTVTITIEDTDMNYKMLSC